MGVRMPVMCVLKDGAVGGDLGKNNDGLVVGLQP